MRIYRRIMAVIYAAVAVVWMKILSEAFIFAVSDIKATQDGYYVDIGATALPALRLLSGVLLLIWAVVILAFCVLNLAAAFRKKRSKGMRIATGILYIAAAAVGLLIPPQSYVTSYFMTFRSLLGINAVALAWPFFWCSVAVAVLTGLSLLPFPRKERVQ